MNIQKVRHCSVKRHMKSVVSKVDFKVNNYSAIPNILTQQYLLFEWLDLRHFSNKGSVRLFRFLMATKPMIEIKKPKSKSY